ncbi:MAG: hypothetical protein ACO3A4_11020 [Silvanigrellaceae bacterium]
MKTIVSSHFIERFFLVFFLAAVSCTHTVNSSDGGELEEFAVKPEAKSVKHEAKSVKHEAKSVKPEEIPFKTLKLNSSGWKRESDNGVVWRVITNDSELKSAFALFYPQERLPQIDFKTNSLIIVHESYRDTCCSISIDGIQRADGAKDRADAVLKLIRSMPGRNCPSGDALSGAGFAVIIPSTYQIKKILISVEQRHAKPDCG